MILTVGGIKGGTGKTTIATNFACMAAADCPDVLLVDADDQKTSSDFTSVRKQDHPNAARYTCAKLTGMSVRTEVLELSRKYSPIIIDTGGRDTTSQRAALTISTVLLVPFAPRSFDIWTLNTVAGMIEEIRTVNAGLNSYAFLNHTDPAGQGTDNQDAADMLRDVSTLKFLDAPLGRRKAYAHAATQGLSVTELVRPHRNQQAINEIMTLYAYVFDVTQMSVVKREAVSL